MLARRAAMRRARAGHHLGSAKWKCSGLTERSLLARDALDPRPKESTMVEVLSTDERKARGRAARTDAPRRSHGEWQPSPERPDPIDLLEQQAAFRVAELVPIRYGRMLASPFASFPCPAL